VLELVAELFVRRASGLVRELEWYDVMIWAIACPAASGMTYYAAKMLGDPSAYGGDPVLAFVIAGLTWLPLIGAFMIIASSFPRTGSLYVFVSRTVHPILGYIPFWYFIIGGGAAMVSGFILFIGIKAMAGAWTVAGLVSGHKELIDIVNIITDPWKQFYIAIALVIFLCLLNVFGVRVIKVFMRVITIIPLVITILVLLGLFIVGRDAALQNWDRIFGAGTAKTIMDAAFKGGEYNGITVEPLKKVPLWEGTYSMLLWTLWAWTGFEAVTFVGSEVKHPTRSYVKGYIGAFIAIMLLYAANAYLVPLAGNYDFIAAYSYLKMDYPDVLSSILKGLPTPDPSVPFTASVAFAHPSLHPMLIMVIALLIGFAYFLWYLNTAVVCWVAGVRGFFAMAFDRALPEKLASVSARLAAPTWANLLTAFIAFLGVVFTLLDAMGSALAAGVVAFMDFSCLFFVWPVGLALILIPWWRPDLFKQMTCQSKALLVFVGSLTFMIGWFYMVFTAYTEIPVVATNILVGIIGIWAFAAMAARNRRRGIEIEKIYYEIPPA
jgi:amino acid transporter